MRNLGQLYSSTVPRRQGQSELQPAHVFHLSLPQSTSISIQMASHSTCPDTMNHDDASPMNRSQIGADPAQQSSPPASDIFTTGFSSPNEPIHSIRVNKGRTRAEKASPYSS